MVITHQTREAKVRPGWRLLAACQGLDGDLFFGQGNLQTAKDICASCPVCTDCLEDALSWPHYVDSAGIRGGMGAEARRRLRKRRRERGV